MPVSRLDSCLPRVRLFFAAAVALLAVTACGGGGSSSTGSVRLVNATRSHASIDLLSNSTVIAPAITLDNASSYVGVAAGTANLQINDAGTSTVLTTIAPSIGGSLHYAVIAYETGGRINSSVLGEDLSAPAAGSASVRVLNAAPDAGPLDVYISDPATPLSSLSTPTFSLPVTTSTTTTALVSFTAGNYRIRVTGSGNISDLRLDIPAVTLASQEIGTVMLTGAVGGVLIDGGVLVQQGNYTATRNANVRVRLAAAVSGGATVGATAGAAVVAAPAISPSVGAYAVVPAANALAVTVNGVTVPGVIASPAQGSDSTLLVYGDPAAPVVTVVPDDNHLPTTNTLYKLRLINGFTGAVSPLTLTADFAPIANNIPGGTASSYGTATASTAVRLDVTSATSLTPVLSLSTLNIPANSVFSLFMLGDASANPAQYVLRRDR